MPPPPVRRIEIVACGVHKLQSGRCLQPPSVHPSHHERDTYDYLFILPGQLQTETEREAGKPFAVADGEVVVTANLAVVVDNREACELFTANLPDDSDA